MRAPGLRPSTWRGTLSLDIPRHLGTNQSHALFRGRILTPWIRCPPLNTSSPSHAREQSFRESGHVPLIYELKRLPSASIIFSCAIYLRLCVKDPPTYDRAEEASSAKYAKEDKHAIITLSTSTIHFTGYVAMYILLYRKKLRLLYRKQLGDKKVLAVRSKFCREYFYQLLPLL